MNSLAKFFRHWIVATLTLGAALAAPVRFDLPAQSAALALAAFAKQAGTEVLFPFDELKSVQSTAVTGPHEPAEALALLLRGTGFQAVTNAAGKFLVVRAARAGARGEIRATLFSAADDTPLAGAFVRLADATTGVRTRSDGSFVLRDVPEATHALIAKADGFTAARIEAVAVHDGQRTELGRVRLAPLLEGPEQLAEVIVSSASLGAASRPVSLSLPRLVVTPSRYGVDELRGAPAATLTESDLLALPQLGADLYRAIAHLPGLAADDLTARFWVRGAPHDQVLARLDGVDLLEPFHLKDTDGSLSILDLETISRLDLFTGGFAADFGDRLAGVLTMETDTFVRSGSRTTLGLSLTGAHLANRGQSKNGRSRWLVSARSGYPDIAIDANDTDGGEIKPRYHDLMGKWEYRLTPEHTFSLHALHAGDRMYFRDSNGPVLTSRYDSDYAWARWRGDFGRLQGEGVLSLARLTWRRDAHGRFDNRYATDLRDDRKLTALGFRQDWTMELSERALVRGGLELKSGEADYDFASRRERVAFRNGAFFIENFGRTARATPDSRAVGAFLAARVQPWEGFALEPGLRHDGNTHAHDSDVSPRLNAAWHRGRSTWRAAWGRYGQSQGLHQLQVQDGETAFHRAEHAEHRVLSFDHRLRNGINLRVEAYERLVRRPRPRWENVIDPTDTLPELNGDRLRLDPARAQARGLEFVAERRGGGPFAWSASYALARAEETLRNGLTIPRARDQRHTLNFDVTWTPNSRWQFSATGQYHSGWPVTEPVYFRAPLSGGGTAIINTLGPLYGVTLPDYQRLDLRAQRRFILRHGVLRVYLDVFNLLDRKNRLTYAYDVSAAPGGQVVQRRKDGEKLFPRLPSVGLTWDF